MDGLVSLLDLLLVGVDVLLQGFDHAQQLLQLNLVPVNLQVALIDLSLQAAELYSTEITYI